MRLAAACSLGPPHTMITRSPVRRWSPAATAAKRSSGQIFDSHPAPGLISTGGPGRRSGSSHFCTAARLAGQWGMANCGRDSRTPRAVSSWQLRSTTCAAVARTGWVEASQAYSRASGRACPMRIGAPESQVATALFKSPWRSMAASGAKAMRSRRSAHTARGCLSQPRGTRKMRSTAGWPAKTSAARPSATQPTATPGKARLSATATGTPWSTSPIADNFTMTMERGMGMRYFPGRMVRNTPGVCAAAIPVSRQPTASAADTAVSRPAPCLPAHTGRRQPPLGDSSRRERRGPR